MGGCSCGSAPSGCANVDERAKEAVYCKRRVVAQGPKSKITRQRKKINLIEIAFEGVDFLVWRETAFCAQGEPFVFVTERPTQIE